MRKNNIFYMF